MVRVALLDHGYLELVESWGSDEAIICAARMSTAKGFQGWGPIHEASCALSSPPMATPSGEICDCDAKPGDEKLLRFMWEHDHGTPFEMAGFTIEVKAPIMVFREWHRHRVPFGYNEMSARYVPLPNENYFPTVARIIDGARKAGKNKQAQGVVDKVPTTTEVEEWLKSLERANWWAEQAYQKGLELGVPKELARLSVNVSRYSVMRATANLRGWLGFMKLRCAESAQYEIRVYANEVANIVAKLFPRTHELWMGP